MDHLENELTDAVRQWDDRGWPRPRVGLVSGSGLSLDLGFEIVGTAPFEDLFPGRIHRLEGHPLEVEILLPLPDRPVASFRGRLHRYQGYTSAETVFPVRLAALLGAEVLVMTNASGAVDPDIGTGSITVVTDHLNLSGANPLRGEPPEEWGSRFPDMTDAYDPALRRIVREVGRELEIPVEEGIYAGLAGPSYETPAEVSMLRTLGADLVGMSTVLEVIAARHLGTRCLCLSVVGNPAAGLVDGPLDHDDVLAAGEAAAGSLRRLLRELLRHPSLL